MDDVLLYGLISKSSKPDDFAVVGKYLSVEPYAIMMRKDEPQFERIVNRALIDLFQSGEIRRIYAKWFDTKDLTVPLNQYLKEAFAVAEYLSCVALSRADAPSSSSVAAARTALRRHVGIEIASRGHGLISVVSTSFSNSSAEARDDRARGRDTGRDR